MKRALAAGAFAALFAVAAWWLAWSSVSAQLHDDARRRIHAWERGATPWTWALDHADAIVMPGTAGFVARHEASRDALVGTVPDGNADFSIDLQGEAIDLARIRGATVEMSGPAPMTVSLFADAGRGAEQLGSRMFTAGTAGFIPFDRGVQGNARSLRLHVEVAPGADIALATLSLEPAARWQSERCATWPACDAAVPRLAPPAFATPERLLAWRNAVLREHPAAIVEPESAASQMRQRVVALAEPRRGRSSDDVIWWTLTLAPVFVGVLSWSRTRPRTRLDSALQLGLLFAPWVVLHWAGVPADAFTQRTTWPLIGAVVGALLVKPQPGWRVIGERAAWRALLPFVLAAAAILVFVAWLGGFETRALPWSKAWQYPLWVLLQQWILMHAIAPSTRILARSRPLAGALLAGAVFALLHVPNFALMLATFAAGSAWAWQGYRHRALLPLAAVHVAAGLALLWLAPPWLLRSAEIGARYLMAP